MSGAHLLEARGLGKYFGNVVALRDVSAELDAGQVLCVLGDNGAGKSTLIKILSGVHQPDAGRLLVDGQDAKFSSPRDARAAGIATAWRSPPDSVPTG